MYLFDWVVAVIARRGGGSEEIELAFVVAVFCALCQVNDAFDTALSVPTSIILYDFWTKSEKVVVVLK